MERGTGRELGEKEKFEMDFKEGRGREELIGRMI